MNSRVIMGALSGWQHEDRRQRCRSTWFNDAKQTVGLNSFFLIGAEGRVTEPTVLGDLLLLPTPNDYPSLPQRTRWFCKWALERDDWDYLFKCDDDTYVSIARLCEYDTGGQNYIGGEWSPGIGYASGGAGYFLSRTAAEIVARELTSLTGDEDALVGQVLRGAGIDLNVDNRFVGHGDNERRPQRGNSVITTHAISADTFLQSHRETTAHWKFRIVMPTCDAYAQSVVSATLNLLRRYWDDHPPVDVLHYERQPPEFDRVTRLYMGNQSQMPWSRTLTSYLEMYNHDQLVMLMLDDYGLCRPADRASIRMAQAHMLADPSIGNVHMTWQPANPKKPNGPLLQLPKWAYSVNTQAALWRRDLLLYVLKHHGDTTIEQFELDGSAWFNAHRFDQDAHCQVPIPEPSMPSSFVDETDKTHWALPYHNLMRRGRIDQRHASFLSNHGVQFSL